MKQILKNEFFIFFSLFLFFVIIISPLSMKTQLWLDEVLESEPAYNFAFKNKLSLKSWAGVLAGVEDTDFMRPPVHFMLLGWLYRLFGFKRFVTLTLPLLLASASFALSYLIAIILTKDRAVSIVSSLLFGLSGLGVSMAKWGRTDATALFFFNFSLLIFLTAMRYSGYLRKTLILFSAILLSLSSQTYQLYVFLFFSFLLYYILEFNKKNGLNVNELLIFLFGFFLPFTLWGSFILKNPQAFINQARLHFYWSSNLLEINTNNFILIRLKEILYLFLNFSPISAVLFVIGNIVFIKNFPQHKYLFFSFILFPLFILFALNILKNNYIEIILPLGYIGLGFLTTNFFRYLKTGRTEIKRKHFLVGVLLSIFILSHLSLGIGGRYFIAIKDWKIRNLAAYEGGLKGLIPSGSIVLGGPENWYALLQSNSELLLLECANQPSFNWEKLDYIIIPMHSNLKQSHPSLLQFIHTRCQEIRRIGQRGYAYELPDKSQRQSGYSSIIFKVLK